MRAVFIFLSLCIASMAYGQLVKTAKNDQTKAESKQDKRGTQEQPLVVQGVPTPKDEAEASEQRQHRAHQVSVGTSVSKALDTLAEESILTTRLTLVLFIATAVQAFLIWLTFRDNKKVAQAARDSADAAKKIANISERGLLELESARVQINIPSTQGALKWGNHAGPYVTYNLTNHGRTPATIIGVRVKMIDVESDRWPPRGNCEDFAVHDPSRNLLPGGSSEGFYVSFGRELTEAETADPHRIHFVGRLQYDDIFHRRHTRWFCYKRFPVEGHPDQFSWAERGPENYNEETVAPAPSAA